MGGEIWAKWKIGKRKMRGGKWKNRGKMENRRKKWKTGGNNPPRNGRSEEARQVKKFL